MVEQAIPRGVADRAGWAADISNGLKVQGLEASRQNVCAVVAVIEQGIQFQVNTVVPGAPGPLPGRRSTPRAEHAGVPLMIVHSALVGDGSGAQWRRIGGQDGEGLPQ